MSETEQEERDDDILAAEVALGLLDGEEAAMAAERVRTDQVFADKVTAWEGRFAAFAETLPVQMPRAAVKAQIDRVLFEHKARRGFWSSLPVWRGATAALAALSLLLAVTLVLQPKPVVPEIYVAAMSGEVGEPILVTLDRAGAEIRLAAFDIDLEDRVTELWLIAEGEDPHSIGVVEPQAEIAVALNEELISKVGPQMLVAISLEPVGGSPTGLPTGPVVAVGQLRRI